MKQALLNTTLGRAALTCRNAFDLLRAPLVEIGTVANDQLAGRLVTRLCAKGKVFVDVGAHIGSVVSEVARHCPGSRIVAIEAIPEKASRLRAKFLGIEVHACAASDVEGEVSFFIDDKRSGYSSLARSGGALREIRVPARRLDNLLADANLDMIKIDVEGAELGVLRGAEDLTSRCRPIVMFESGPGDVLGYTKDQMYSWFAEHNYGLFIPNRLAHTGPPLSLDCFLDSHEYPRRTTNYFAVPAERTEEIREKARRLC